MRVRKKKKLEGIEAITKEKIERNLKRKRSLRETKEREREVDYEPERTREMGRTMERAREGKIAGEIKRVQERESG